MSSPIDTDIQIMSSPIDIDIQIHVITNIFSSGKALI